jgi:RNA-binding protein
LLEGQLSAVVALKAHETHRSRTLPKPAPPRTPKTAPKPTKKSGLRQTHKKTVKKIKLSDRKLLVLTGRQRTFLRGLAHDINPLMQLGKDGTKPALLAELDRTLDAHELIKVRVLRECPDDLDTLESVIESELKANVVGKLGRVFVLYRRNPEKPRIVLPNVKKPVASKPALVELDDEGDEVFLDDDDDDDDEKETWEE